MTIKSSEERRAVLQISAKLDKMDPEIRARVIKSVASMFGYTLDEPE